MSAAPSTGASANKNSTTEKSADATKEVKPAAALEEDDEFEDFPVEGTSLGVFATSYGGRLAAVGREEQMTN
jgi:hypothetical protein